MGGRQRDSSLKLLVALDMATRGQVAPKESALAYRLGRGKELGRGPASQGQASWGTAAPAPGGDFTTWLPRPSIVSLMGKVPRKRLMEMTFSATTLLLQCRRLCTGANQSPRKMAKRAASRCRRDSEAVPTPSVAVWAQSIWMESPGLLRW